MFLPIGLVGGQAGAIFRPFAVAVTVALLASLFVALTVVPMFASWFMKPTAKQQVALAAQQGKPEKNTLVQKGLPAGAGLDAGPPLDHPADCARPVRRDGGPRTRS